MDTHQEIIFLRSWVQELENRLLKVQDVLNTVVTKNDDLTKQLTVKDDQIKQLTKELDKYKHRKDSNNSSTPPSQDQNRSKRNQSLRVKSGKKPGGQQGHDGNTLKMILAPDKYVHHIPTCCTSCGKDLMDRPVL